MDKRQDNSGFTLIETMLTLFIVSIILFVTIIHIPNFGSNRETDEIKNIKYFLEKSQFEAMIKETVITIRFDYNNNQIIKKDSKTKEIDTLVLHSCILKEGGLSLFSFNAKGDSNAFGTLYLICDKKIFKIIFQIQKGRFRIE